MLIFSCTECKKKINCPDNEAVDEAFIRLDKHIEKKCALARFMFEGTTKASRRDADTIQSVMANQDLLARLQTAGAILNLNRKRPGGKENSSNILKPKSRMIAFE
jgi:hypothetical protein